MSTEVVMVGGSDSCSPLARSDTNSSSQEEASAGEIPQPLLDRYKVEGLLGEGSSGVVYLASDLRLHRPVALKLLRRDLRSEVGGWLREHNHTSEGD